MKAVRLNEIGGPQQLRIESIPDPTPGEGEILVRVTRAAFNRRDVFITQGLYPGISLPRTLGSDGTGTVAALGVGVPGPGVGTPVVIDPMLGWGADPGVWEKGNSILGMPHDGTFAEYVLVPAANVHPKPAHLSDDEAAALPLGGLTAYRALVTRGRITPADVVLLTGIGGGVQTFALLFAVSIGARTIVTSSSDEKLERAKAMGADVAINYATSASWSKAVRAAAADGGGPSLILDSAGGETFAQCLDIARPGARVVTYGGTAATSNVRMFSIFWKHLDILGSSMGSPEDFAGMLALVSERQLKPAVDGVVAMDDVVAGAERLNAAAQFGKIVLAIA
jgi:zinc-binding alcohol dehydrogenase/oxidoreductase